MLALTSVRYSLLFTRFSMKTENFLIFLTINLIFLVLSLIIIIIIFCYSTVSEKQHGIFKKFTSNFNQIFKNCEYWMNLKTTAKNFRRHFEKNFTKLE